MIAEWLVRYYDKPRSRFSCAVGALLIAPVLTSLRRQLRSDERKMSRNTALLGRLELTAKLLSRWWSSGFGKMR